MKKEIIYEVKNILGNIFTIIFGFIFPTLMTIILYNAIKADINITDINYLKIHLFVSNAVMIPLAIVFVGFVALFSQEIEKGVVLRMSLFGYTEKRQLKAKFISQLIVVFISLLLYSIIIIPVLKIPEINMLGFVYILISYLILTVLFFIIGFSISLLTKRFSVSFGITMSLYFIIMILSGMMGVSSDDLPFLLKQISYVLPTNHLIKNSYNLWNNIGFELTGLIISFIIFIIISTVLYFIAFKNRKNY